MKHLSNHKKFLGKLIGLVTLVASLVVVFGGCVAQTVTEEASTYQKGAQALNKVYAYELNLLDAQSPAQAVQTLAFSAGTSASDWAFLYFLNQDESLSDNTDLMNFYQAALLGKLSTDTKLSGTERERIGLCLAATQGDAKTIASVIDEGSLEQGIMSEIYGLRLHATGTYSSLITVDKLLRLLMEQQQESGAFGLSDNIPDVDVTAMAIQAMAPYYKKCEASIRLALQYLMRAQKENHAYASMDLVNAESTAQVLCALGSLKAETNHRGEAGYFAADMVDATEVLEALLSFQNEDGSFCHVEGDGGNAMATLQSWGALQIYYENYAKQYPASKSEKFEHRSFVMMQLSKLDGFQLRLFLALGVVAIFLITCIYMIFRGQKRPRKYVVALVLTVIAVVLIFVLRIETPSEYRERIANSEGNIETTIEIQGVDGTILATTTVYVQANGSAFDQLNLALTKEEIAMSYSGSTLFSNIYVQSIDGLAERAYGDLSGWLYSVNGEYPQVSCSAYGLKTGDVVIWQYTTDGEVFE